MELMKKKKNNLIRIGVLFVFFTASLFISACSEQV